MQRALALSFVAVILASAPGCNQPSPVPPAQGASEAVADAAEPAAPHGGGAGEKALSAEGSTVATPNFRFELPANWRREQPSSGMRLAQAVVPGPAGPGELAVFHFGAGQGGGVESNFERWLGQVELLAGTTPERGELTAAGFRISWIDARGPLLPSTMGRGPTTAQAGFRPPGAVVEGQGGPWFFKVTGPEATLAPQRESFFGLLRGVRRP